MLVKLCNSHRHHSANYTNIIIDFSSSAEQVSNPPFEVSECDTAKLLIGQENLKHLSRDHIYKILKTEPDSNASSYPCTWTSASRSFRQFQPSLMKKFPWLHYSPYVDEAYCCACVLFDCREAGGGHVLGHFVTSPFKMWIKMSEKVTSHAQTKYHLFAMTKMDEFLTHYDSPSMSINMILNLEELKIMENNRKVIESLFHVVILCGVQGLPFHGHRDDNID